MSFLRKSQWPKYGFKIRILRGRRRLCLKRWIILALVSNPREDLLSTPASNRLIKEWEKRLKVNITGRWLWKGRGGDWTFVRTLSRSSLLIWPPPKHPPTPFRVGACKNNALSSSSTAVTTRNTTHEHNTPRADPTVIYLLYSPSLTRDSICWTR